MKKNKLVILTGLATLVLIILFISQFKFVRNLKLLKSAPGKTYAIRIGCSSLTPLHCMFCEIFKHTDILKKQGLEGHVTFFTHGSNQNEACRKKEIDTTFSCEVPAVLQLAECPDFKITGSPGSLGRISLVSRKESNIPSIADFKNKRILVQGGSSAMMAIRKWISDAGLDPDHDVYLMESDKDTVIKKLFNGEGDGVVLWDPWLEIFLKRYNLKIIKERLFGSVIFVSEEYLLSFPEAYSRYNQALEDALLWAANNKEIVNEWVSKRSGIEPDVIKKVLLLNKKLTSSRGMKKNADIHLTPEDIKILKECSDYCGEERELPTGFDIRNKILAR